MKPSRISPLMIIVMTGTLATMRAGRAYFWGRAARFSRASLIV